MSTVVRRTVQSTPFRDADATWTAIVDMLCKGGREGARAELLAVAGTACSVIADQAARDEPVVATCDGPRTRIYCLHDDAATEGGDENETALPYDALKGDWHVSLPCPAEDLAWVSAALSRKTARVTARAPGEKTVADNAAVAATGPLELDLGSLSRG